MAITVTLGVNKKVGLPDYGSAGSHCDVVIEVDNSTLDNPALFQQRVQSAYFLAREAVENELLNHKANNGTSAPQSVVPKIIPPPKTEYRSQPQNVGGSPKFPASEKQWDFISRLTKGFRGFNHQKLEEYCQTTFGKGCEELSSRDASLLIDNLKAAKAEKREVI
ncbi:hypothetical protein FACS189419_07000 [Planctomycetales bacterium]|nr:hypothetical protein FACS189419_07000 [Planctomycetales bacterium]